MESLKRMREPAAFIVLAVLWLQLLINLVEFFVYGSQLHGSLAEAALVTSAQMPQTLMVLLALFSTVVTILVALSLGVMGMVAESVTRVLDLVELLLPIVVGVLVVFALARLLPMSATQGGEPEPPAVTEASPGEAVRPTALPSPRQEPVWQPDAASGVAWYSAGDAAVGAPAAGWGTPDESGGWYPMPDERA